LVELGENLKLVRCSESKCGSSCHPVSVLRKYLLSCSTFLLHKEMQNRATRFSFFL